MINNTSPQRWDRISVKSLDMQFNMAMQQGLNCSPFEAEIMVEKVHEIFSPLFRESNSLKPGQTQVLVLDASVSPGVPLAKAAQVLVTVTLHDPKEDIPIRQLSGVPALRQHRLARICDEAFQQGGLFTLEDLSLLLNCGVRTLVSDLNDLRKQQILLPLRSTIKDIGRAISHRQLIVSLWLQGKEYSDIAFRSRHSVKSVANYVAKYKRCATLFAQNFDLQTTAFLVRISCPLAAAFLHIFNTALPVPHRQLEIQDALKKTPPSNASERSQP